MDLTPEQQACNQNTTPQQLRALAMQSKQLARLVCTNPNADPDLLRELANRSDYIILSTVASNPNTPTDVLWKVGVEFPEEVLSNPIFPLLLLEHPNLIDKIPNKTLESFLKVDLVPDAFIRSIVDSYKRDDFLLAVAMNPKTSKEILEKLISNKYIIIVKEDQHVIDSVKLHINWSREISANWQEAAFAIIQNTFFGCSLIDFTAYQVGLIPESLMIKSGRHVFANIASSSNTSIHTLEQIAENIFSKSIKCAVYKLTLIALTANPNTPLNLLERLLGEFTISSSKSINEKVLYNPSIPLTLLQKFYSSNIAVKNLDTPSETLQELAKNQWICVRRGVAYHPNTSVNVLIKLSEESDKILHIAIALNHNTTADILHKIILKNLHSYEYLSVFEAVINNRNASEQTLELILKDNHHCYFIKRIAYHPNVTENLLEKLVNINSDAVTTAVAASVKTPASLLLRLAKTQDNSIRMAVAGNPNTSKELQSELKAHTSRIFSKKAIKNHRRQLLEAVDSQLIGKKIAENFDLGFVYQEQNPEVFLRLAQQNNYSVKQEAVINLYQFLLINSDVSMHILEQAAKISNPALEAAIIRHSNTSIDILKQFAKHRKPNIRLLITQNPKTPISLLKVFLQDKDKLVRESALGVYQQYLPEEKDVDFSEQLQIVQNISTVSKILNEIATSKWLIIRERVALHPNTSIDTLIKLADDKARHVQLAVAQNTNTPDEILEKLAHRHKWNTDVHIAAVKNLISRASKQASKFIGQYIKESPFGLGRFFALLHPLAPTHLLIKNYRSIYWLERYAIAQNPNTPKYIRELLTQDANRIVRAAAKANILRTG